MFNIKTHLYILNTPCLEVLDDTTADQTEDTAVRDIVTFSASISHSIGSVITIHFCHFFKKKQHLLCYLVDVHIL